MLTIADIRDMYLQADSQAQEIIERGIAEYIKPDLLDQAMMMAISMPPEVRRLVDPTIIEQLRKVINA